MLTASSLAWKTSLRKSQDAVALAQIKERGALPMIDRSGYPSGNRPLQQYLGFTAGRWLWSVRAWRWQPDCKIQRSGRNGQRDWWAESPRLPPPGLSASSSACHGLLIITVITPLPTKPSATKMPENHWSWRTRQLLATQIMRQRDVAALDAKYNEAILMLKLKMMLCVMMLPLVVVGCTSKQSVSQCAGLHRLAWIMQPPPTGRHRWTGLFHPQREADHYAKTTGRKPRSILMSSADRVAHIDGQLMQLLWAIHTRFQRSINAQSNKTEAIHLRMFVGLLNNIFCAATNFGCIDSFSSAQFQKRRNDGWWFPLVLLLPVCFEQ